ncbi:DUF6542 domain-containing protein [Haloechinothrix sp. LS1_15]|uniref:DUF6542 domain-containing protein n=1 Tax=Haloechinothrix sp. LS1_15 TaxID=2652248 RepID=UPI0029460805|nr:DUF6542 domain-containing protein [Haloechinothrix sp. LS1_15]MDV6011539.1 hypothetical protein [Haloechinothrix sp. LS1_15]
MASSRERRDADDIEDANEAPAWDERPLVGSGRGLSWSWATAIALLLAAGAAVVDARLHGEIGTIFEAGFFAGAVLAVCAVRRRNLFGPVIQPPLIFALVVPGVVLYASGIPGDADTLSRVLAVGTPIIHGFPIMAAATATTLMIGLLRLLVQRDPARRKPAKAERDSSDRPERRGKRPEPRPSERTGGDRPGRTTGERERPGRQRPGADRAEGTGGNRAPRPTRGDATRAVRDTRGPRPWEAERQAGRPPAPERGGESPQRRQRPQPPDGPPQPGQPRRGPGAPRRRPPER